MSIAAWRYSITLLAAGVAASPILALYLDTGAMSFTLIILAISLVPAMSSPSIGEVIAEVKKQNSPCW